MAGDLVGVKKNQVTQTFVHDLESAFYILLYLVTRFVGTSWPMTERCDYIRNVLGGGLGTSGKRLFMEARLIEFSIPSNAPLEGLIVELKRVLAKRYSDKHDKENPALKSSSFGIEYNDSELNYDKILEPFTTALSSSDWPQDDKAIEQPISNDGVSSEYIGPKRSRPDGDDTPSKRHKSPSNSDNP